MPVVGQNGVTETVNNSVLEANVDLRYKIVGTCMLKNFSKNEILQDIARRIEDGRRLIIPIGLPQAGKSMFIASLIAYAFRRDQKQDNSCNFMHVFPQEISGVKKITDALDNRTVLPTTTKDFITIIDLNMKSRYRNRIIKITLIDLSGEDIQSMVEGDISETNQDTIDKIKNILAACIARKAIFAVLTPVNERLQEIGQVSSFDKQEDTKMKAFIDKIRVENPSLYKLTKFLIVITKWDKLPEYIGSAKFLQLHRNQLYNEYSSNSKSYGLIPYSVGNVVGETIMNIILQSPKNFWYTLYRWCTGKHVLPWWKRLFS